MIITKTPLRISLLGGATDIESFWRENDGCVISMAIDKFVMVITKRRNFNNKLFVNYSKREEVNNLNDLKHDLVKECIEYTETNPQGLEVTLINNLPFKLSGTGIGSSSSFTVSLLHNLLARKGKIILKKELADKSCEIEINRLQRPIGKQDQYIAVYGGIKMLRFFKNGQVEVSQVPISSYSLDKLQKNLIMFFIGNRNCYSSDILENQKSRAEYNVDTLLQMRDLAYRCINDLTYTDDVDNIGYLLRDSWELKKTLAKGITNNIIDEYYDIARRYGALGGKVCGAGGGGFLLLYVPENKQEKLIERMKEESIYQMPFEIDHVGSTIIWRGKVNE